jgi:hypothetical protein
MYLPTTLPPVAGCPACVQILKECQGCSQSYHMRPQNHTCGHMHDALTSHDGGVLNMVTQARCSLTFFWIFTFLAGRRRSDCFRGICNCNMTWATSSHPVDTCGEDAQGSLQRTRESGCIVASLSENCQPIQTHIGYDPVRFHHVHCHTVHECFRNYPSHVHIDTRLSPMHIWNGKPTFDTIQPVT